MIELTALERTFITTQLALVALFPIYKRIRSTESYLSTFTSLIYSSVFPFTVSIGKLRGYSTTSPYSELSLTMACVNMYIRVFNPTLRQWLVLMPLIHERWCLPTLLYVVIFATISGTAQTSFNFEEVSLISQAATHALFFVVDSPTGSLSPPEIFLPAFTFGILFAIAPALPILRKIKTSSSPIKSTILIFILVIASIFILVRPWLVAELGEDPIEWVWNYMTRSEGHELRLAIVGWWFTVLAFGIIVPVKFFTAFDGQDSSESRNKRRKFFHGIVVLLFLPALSIDVLGSLDFLMSSVILHQLQCHLRHLCFCSQRLYDIIKFLQSAPNSKLSSLYLLMSVIHEVLLLSVIYSFL